ncbi:MAG: polyprenyl synthetase family protein [Gemmatimonadetes bacterium]|nr:polyprenyl synthetase family protein [Gemmatimonadota bacterium]
MPEMTADRWGVARSSFDVYLETGRGHIEAALRRSVTGMGEVIPSGLLTAVEDGVMGAGKRLRPLLLVTACEETGGRTSDDLYDLAVSVELIHAYSLIHDDLPCMDDAPLRRGRPTAHIVHGVHTAMYAGAVIIPWAAAWAFDSARRMGRTGGQARDIVAHLLEAAGAGGMIGGQALDLLGEGRSLGEDELAELHGLKTGALLAASLELGAMASGADSTVRHAIGSFGRDLGLAFQVMDDVLDATGSADVLGKRPSDAEQEKSTYVALLGVEGARAHGRRLVDRGAATLDAVGLAAPRLRQLARLVIQRRR